MKTLCLFLILFLGFYSGSAQSQILEHSVAPGETLSYGSKEITFIKVVSDSRCPKDVTCIWAGNAVILVEIRENGAFLEQKEIVLSAGRNLTLLLIEDSSLLVQNLLPYPETGSNVEDREYSLELKVRPN